MSEGRLLQRLTVGRLWRYSLMFSMVFFSLWLHETFLGEGIINDHGGFIARDYVAFYTGAQLWDGDTPGADLYDFELQASFQHELSEGRTSGRGGSYFINPPIALLLYLPFSKLPYFPSAIAWILFGVVLLYFGVRALHSWDPPLQVHSRVRLFGLFILATPTVVWLVAGQITTVVLAIWIFVYVSLRKRHEFRAGLILSLLAFKPQLALGWVLVFVFSRRWKALVGGAVGLCISGLISFFVFEEETYAFVEAMPRIGGLLQDPAFPREGIHSIFGFSNLLLGDIHAGAGHLLTLILSLLLLVFVGTRWSGVRWDSDAPRVRLLVAVTLIGGLLVGIHLFTYDLMLLTFPLVLVVSGLREAGITTKLPLDGGPILISSVAVAVLSVMTPPVLAQILMMERQAGLPASVIHIIPILLVIWILLTSKAAASLSSSASGPEPDPRLSDGSL